MSVYFSVCVLVWADPWALITLLLFDRKNYFYLCGVMFSGMALCLLLYLIFPNGVDLRPQSIESSNLAAIFVRMIWSADTSTNVCPSIHVASTFSIFLAVQLQQNLETQKACSWNLRCAHHHDLLVHPLLETAFGD